jgi:hypothetical protein
LAAEKLGKLQEEIDGNGREGRGAVSGGRTGERGGAGLASVWIHVLVLI